MGKGIDIHQSTVTFRSVGVPFLDRAQTVFKLFGYVLRFSELSKSCRLVIRVVTDFV